MRNSFGYGTLMRAQLELQDMGVAAINSGRKVKSTAKQMAILQGLNSLIARIHRIKSLPDGNGFPRYFHKILHSYRSLSGVRLSCNPAYFIHFFQFREELP
jgi:hypothetical protein